MPRPRSEEVRLRCRSWSLVARGGPPYALHLICVPTPPALGVQSVRPKAPGGQTSPYRATEAARRWYSVQYGVASMIGAMGHVACCAPAKDSADLWDRPQTLVSDCVWRLACPYLNT